MNLSDYNFFFRTFDSSGEFPPSKKVDQYETLLAFYRKETFVLSHLNN